MTTPSKPMATNDAARALAEVMALRKHVTGIDWMASDFKMPRPHGFSHDTATFLAAAVNFTLHHAQHFAGLESRCAVLEAWASGPHGVRWYIEQNQRLEAEVAKARADAERFCEIAKRFQYQKTSESELFLSTLRIDGDPLQPLREIIDAALLASTNSAGGESHD